MIGLNAGPQFTLDEAFSSPERLEELSGRYSTEVNKRAMEAMLQMTKIDIATLEQADAGEQEDAPA